MTRRPWTLLTAAGIALAILGCVPTALTPPYTEKDLVFDPVLVGSWAKPDPGEKEVWVFEKANDLQYRLVITDDNDKTASFEARLFKLGTTQLLDMFPDDAAQEGLNANGYLGISLVRSHVFGKVTRTGTRLELWVIKQEWLNNLLAKEPKAIAWHRVGEDRVLFTASTADLQKFILKYLNTPEGWSDEPMKLEKRPAKEPAGPKP